MTKIKIYAYSEFRANSIEFFFFKFEIKFHINLTEKFVKFNLVQHELVASHTRLIQGQIILSLPQNLLSIKLCKMTSSILLLFNFTLRLLGTCGSNLGFVLWEWVAGYDPFIFGVSLMVAVLDQLRLWGESLCVILFLLIILFGRLTQKKKYLYNNRKYSFGHRWIRNSWSYIIEFKFKRWN